MWGAPRLGNTTMCRDGGVPQCLETLLDLAYLHLQHLLYNKLVNVSVSLSSVGHSNKLLSPSRGWHELKTQGQVTSLVVQWLRFCASTTGVQV